MFSRHNLLEFSGEAEYLAFSSPEGSLKIWETSTGVLKQEYVPSSHLSSSCHSLSWGPTHRISNAAKKAKKCKSSSNLENLQLIAMGTRTGEILLYSFTNSDLYSTLKNGHSSIVSGVAWCKSSNILFSCSHDQHIVAWDVVAGTIKTKWKADQGAIYSISVIDNNNVLTANSTITWWNVQDKKIVKTFSGHATEVFWLSPFLSESQYSSGYFLSAAVGDRVISAWHLSDKSKDCNAVASFVSPDEPTNIDIINRNNEPLKVAAVTKDGSCALFEHSLNGKIKAPMQPKMLIRVASKDHDSSNKPLQVPVFAASIKEGLDSCLIAYGSFLKPMFERLNIADISSDLFLVRDLSFSSALSVEKSISKIKHTDKSSKVKTLAPGHMTLHSSTLSPGQMSLSKDAKKRKKGKLDVSELPMEDRLKALDLGHFPNDDESALKTDSMVHLLLQGLQSKDKAMLNTVLFSSDPLVIRNTLERLPLNSVLALLKEMTERLSKQEQRNHPCLKWLNGLLSLHLPYLMSCKDIDEYLGPISQIIEARLENFSKMLQLRGCLKILLSKSNNVTHYSDATSEPLLDYQSDSSEASDSSEDEASGIEDEEEMVATDSGASSESDMEDDS